MTTFAPALVIDRRVLPSGLRTLVVPLRDARTVAFVLAVGTGSRQESPAAAGTAHFLEHLVFKGSRKRPSTRAIAEAVDRVGGEMNAFTGKEWTVYYAKGAPEHAELLVDVVSDFVLRPLFKASEIERERGVVIEEINMYEDTPVKSIGEFFESALFGGHALGHPIIGTKENLARFPRRHLLRYYRRQYRAGSTVACLAGPIEPVVGHALLRSALAGCPRGTARRARRFRGRRTRERIVAVKDKPTDQTHLIIGSLAVPFLHPDRPAVDIFASLLGGGMSSRLFLEVRERRGLAYAVRTDTEHFVDTGYLATQAGLDSAKLAEAVRVILREMARVRDQRVSRTELAKAREALKGRFLLSLETSDTLALFVACQEGLLRRTVTPDEMFRLLDAVEPRDIRRVARRYASPQNLRLVAIGPSVDAENLARVIRRAT